MKTWDQQLMLELSRVYNSSRVKLVQDKLEKAISDVKRARTLMRKAQKRLEWAKQYKPDPKTLCEVFGEQV